MSLELSRQKNFKVNAKSVLKSILEIRELTLIILIIVSSAILSMANPNFLTSANLKVVIQGFATDMIVGVAVCIALVGGLTDFSVGSTLGLCGIITAMVLNNGSSIIVAILAGLGVGMLAGLFNGVVIARVKMPPMVATIGTWMAYRGFTLVIADGKTAASLPKGFKAIGQGSVLGISTTVFVMVVVILLGWFALNKINFFHNAYYIGGNKESARLAGINVNKFIIVMYVILGFMSAMAGILLASRLGNANVLSGTGLEFRLVVAMLIGGISFDGGEGSLVGGVLGVVMMGIVQNALVMLSINPYWTNAVIGIILIFAVGIDCLNKQRKSRA